MHIPMHMHIHKRQGDTTGAQTINKMLWTSIRTSTHQTRAYVLY